MRPQSIGRLSAVFTLLIGVLILAVIANAWTEVDRLAADIRVRETQAARKEVADAFASISKKINDTAQALAHWDETKQQLSYSEFYPIWRDTRVRDAGIIPGATQPVVALYDKQGNILEASPGPDPMPLKLPGAAPLTQFRHEQGYEHLYHFAPVYAEGGNSLLLGYVGLKLNLRDELKLARSYSYADIEALRVTLPENTGVAMESVPRHLQITSRPNPTIETFSELFRASQMRQSLVILSMLLLAGWFLSRMVVRPLRQLSRQVDTLRDNPDQSLADAITRTTPLPVLELENVRASFNEHLALLAKLHDHLEKSSQSFYNQARHDALTGVFNRRAFDEDWSALADGQRHDGVAMLLFDCDHFKAINDTYGHNVGDSVIQAIAQCLHTALRANDRLYRLGGDEFATVLLNSSASIAAAIAERCLEHVMAHDFRQYGMSEPVTISIGLALSTDEHVTLAELQKHADLAMYTAKRPGNSKVVFYNEEMGGLSALVGNREINVVFQALQNPGMIELAYQAVMRMPMQQKEYVEALTRIRDGNDLIRPDSIFPIVQARNLDAEFDLAVLRAVEMDMESGRLPAGQGVSINLSAPGIVNTKVIAATVELVRRHSGRKIVVEITETALISQMDTATAHIRQLQDAGALVALDDFGSGYSSLRYLASMPVDLVKFDISMIRLLETGDSRQKLIVEEIAGMVRTAGYDMVAEGVETREQLDMIIGMGFTHAQGYYFGKPGQEA